MSWLATLLTEGWPLFAALGLVLLITYGALRPYLKQDAARRDPKKDTSDD
ncbi:hypothetical protein [Oceaniglobus roseus]|nr:hypothetical protein [Kandeliimicrobium roseum]